MIGPHTVVPVYHRHKAQQTRLFGPYDGVLSSTDKATHPTNRQEDWEYIIGFCDQINKELEG